MFNAPFSFDGRIRRTEYGISFIIYLIAGFILRLVIATSVRDSSDSSGYVVGFIFYIPLLWFLWAQGAKRCHDLGNSGWWQIIPFYVFWLLFADGNAGQNNYGDNPKGVQSLNQQTTVPIPTPPPNGPGYQGGYTGGHNHPNSNPSTQSPPKSGEYESGSLYN